MPAVELPPRIGSYRILDVLGRGGMGVVYRGEHLSNGEIAAVKTVRVPHAGMLQSLRREIHALACLRHPGVVRIVAEGLHEGLPWYAMELLEGIPLRQAVTRPALGSAPEETHSTSVVGAAALTVPYSATVPYGAEEQPASRPLEGLADPDSRRCSLHPGSLTAVLTLVRRLCATLSFLHGEGIVHRDLKPENILLRAERTTGPLSAGAGPALPLKGEASLATSAGLWPVLVDFGLSARFTGAISRDELEMGTPQGGTLSYMAPEQLLGDLVDARADLYALGCILYELLTGRRPFFWATRLDLVQAHLHEPPRPPSELLDGVPPALDSLVLRLLAKRPQERLGYADDVAAALERLGASEPIASFLPKTRAYLYRPGFVGRGALISRLELQLDRLEDGSGALVLLGGESGVGKTRLVMELARKARACKALVLTGECLTGAPFQAVLRPLQQVADHCRQSGLAETERVLGRRGPVLAAYEPALAALPGQDGYPAPEPLPPESARLRLFRYLAETLTALTPEPAPTLLILDDLHLAGDLTLGFLQFLLRSGYLGRWPFLVVGTYRAEEADPGLQKLIDSTQVRALSLDRLDPEAVAAIVGDMLALPAPPPLFSQVVAEHSEGNPFFVAEYLRAAVDRELLWRDDSGNWQVAAADSRDAMPSDYESLVLPRSLRELVGRRLDGLSQNALELVLAAAVLGRESDLQLLEAVASLGEVPLLEAVEELLRRLVLEEAEQGRLRFVHDKIREVAYSRLAPALRPELHRVAAETIEAILADRRGEYLADLGGHWEKAGVLDRARDCYLAGARRAASRHATEHAEKLYLAYLALVERPDPQSILVRHELSRQVLGLRGKNREAIEQYDRALEEAGLTGDLEAQARCLTGRGNFEMILGRYEESRASCEQGLSLAQRLGDRPTQASALNNLGSLAFCEGRLEEAGTLYDQTLGLERELGDRGAVCTVLMNLALIATETGRSQDAEAALDEALALTRALGDRRLEAKCLVSLALLRSMRGAIQEARSLAERAVQLGREVGDRRILAEALNELATAPVLLGSLAEARGIYHEALQIFREIGDRRSEAGSWMSIASTLSGPLELEHAMELYEKAQDVFRELGDLQAQAQCSVHLARVHLRQGRFSVARQLFEAARSRFREVGDSLHLAETLYHLAGLERLVAGATSKAEALAGEASGLLQATGAVAQRVHCLCEIGHIALASGRSGLPELEEARRLVSAFETGPAGEVSQALAALERAEAARATGRPLFHGACAEDVPEPILQALHWSDGLGPPTCHLPAP